MHTRAAGAPDSWRARAGRYAAEPLEIEVEVEDKDGKKSSKMECTSHMQVAWRRVKRKYYEVYFFSSALTANDKAAQRRTAVTLTALLIRCARFRACRTGASPEQVARQRGVAGQPYGGLRLEDT